MTGAKILRFTMIFTAFACTEGANVAPLAGDAAAADVDGGEAAIFFSAVDGADGLGDAHGCGGESLASGCSWDIPTGDDGGLVDSRYLNVALRGASGDKTLLRAVATAAACDADSGDLSWYAEPADAGSQHPLRAC